jgi:hypothetical protein
MKPLALQIQSLSNRMKPIYIGPSWAVRSFDTPDGNDQETTNLAQEWNIGVQNLAEHAFSNWMLLGKIRSYVKDNPQESQTPIIWVYGEPLLDTWVYQDTPIEQALTRDDWWQMRERVNQQILQDISELGNPVALIGAHSDIVDCDHPNITVIHPSWQKFLGEQIGIYIKAGWGAEVAHRFIVTDRSIKPSHSVIDAVSELFLQWHKLEMHGLFQICHASLLGNKLFAKAIESDVKKWLSQFSQKRGNNV